VDLKEIWFETVDWIQVTNDTASGSFENGS
jgi:hypothetical protein